MTRYNILILDDDPDDAFLVVDTLDEVECTQYECRTCEHPDEALDALSTGSFDLLICDYRMGAQDGVSFIGELSSKGHDLPSILLTGMADSEADRLALEAGAADFVSKSELSATLLDRTIRYAIAAARRQKLLATVFESVEAAVCVTDQNGLPVLNNSRFAALARQLLPDARRDEALTGLCKLAISQKARRSIGESVLDTATLELPDGRHVITLHDVTQHVAATRERAEAEKAAWHMAHHCSLTGLPNRAALSERLKDAVDESLRTGAPVTLLTLDLDGFKQINDIHGHHAGDELLVEVASRMRAVCSPRDFLGRLAGDEFLVVCEGPVEDGQDLASQLVATVEKPFKLTGCEVTMGISIGIASCPDHASSVPDLLSNADTAMFRGKKVSSEAVVVYDREIDRQRRDRLRMIADLKEAVAADEIAVHYQPQVDVKTGRICGFEALARWNRRGHGAVSPAVFIPLAEECGVIDDLGFAVLRRACRDAAGWDRSLSIAVNVSGAQVARHDFVRVVHGLLLATGLSPSRLELEVTESVLVDDVEEALFVLRGLKSIGVQLAIDDFGTGYSSLTTLTNFPFDRLKIDRSFVSGIGTDKRLETVVKACLGLATSLGLDVVAEGIETAAQARHLHAAGCERFQGFLFGSPCPAEEIANASTVAFEWVHSEDSEDVRLTGT